MYPTQSNTQRGAIVVPANADLTGKEGHLVKLINSSGTAKAALPAAATDVANYLLVEGGAIGADVTVQPIEGAQQIRVVGKSVLAPGDKVVAYGTGAAGQLTKYASGDAYIVGVAEEVGAVGQLVLVRPVGSFIA